MASEINVLAQVLGLRPGRDGVLSGYLKQPGFAVLMEGAMFRATPSSVQPAPSEPSASPKVQAPGSQSALESGGVLPHHNGSQGALPLVQPSPVKRGFMATTPTGPRAEAGRPLSGLLSSQSYQQRTQQPRPLDLMGSHRHGSTKQLTDWLWQLRWSPFSVAARGRGEQIDVVVRDKLVDADVWLRLIAQVRDTLGRGGGPLLRNLHFNGVAIAAAFPYLER